MIIDLKTKLKILIVLIIIALSFVMFINIPSNNQKVSKHNGVLLAETENNTIRTDTTQSNEIIQQDYVDDYIDNDNNDITNI